jgi:hypothetical protein
MVTDQEQVYASRDYCCRVEHAGRPARSIDEKLTAVWNERSRLAYANAQRRGERDKAGPLRHVILPSSVVLTPKVLKEAILKFSRFEVCAIIEQLADSIDLLSGDCDLELDVEGESESEI